MLKPFRPGVLSDDQLKDLVSENVIQNTPTGDNNIDTASIDLHLSDKMFKMRGGIKGRPDKSYSDVIQDYATSTEDLNTTVGVEIAKGETYVIALRETIRLSHTSSLYGLATGKSSIGRLDVLVRLIADYSPYYDELPFPEELPTLNRGRKHTIKLYLEVTPLTFPIKVYSGISLNQLRLFSGHPELSLMSRAQLKHFGNILLTDDGPISSNDREFFHLSVNLDPVRIYSDRSASSFRATNPDNVSIDLAPLAEQVIPNGLWELKQKDNDDVLDINPEEFYIIRSRERFRLPPDVAVYGRAMMESLGELRIHYAGFVHPYFGLDRANGTPLIFEVRGHNIKTFLRHEEVLANLQYYRMSQPANTPVEVYYGDQELKLSKFFKRWE